MAVYEHSETLKIDAERFFDCIKDYESYPEFIEGVKKVEIIQREGNRCLAKFYMQLIRKFEYVSDIVEDRPKSIVWKFKTGEMFKESVGGWEIVPLANGEIKVTYRMEVTPKGFAMRIFLKKIANEHLPKMIMACFNRAKELDS